MSRLSISIRVIFLATFTTILLSTAAWSANEVVLYNFCQTGGYICTDGSSPNGALIFDAVGNLYGTTTSGGANGYGVVFELSPTPSGWTESVLYSFCAQANCADGQAPEGALIFDSLGNLYGTTFSGGAYKHGTVYELSPSPSGWTETVLYSFCAEGGTCGQGVWGYFDQAPQAGVVMDKAGNLFGPTFYNGIFELSPSGAGGWTESRLFEVGWSDPAGVALDGAGNVYGVAERGGLEPDPGGYVFELSKAGGWAESVLFGLPKNVQGQYADGYNVNSTPVFDKAGALYSTTQYNGINVNGGNVIGGTAFKLTPGHNGWTFRLLHRFNGKTDGAQPVGPVVVDDAGNVYGTTYAGGTGVCQGAASYCGTVYKITKSGSAYSESVLWSFHGTDGFHPMAGVILDKAGNLYGTTQSGGTSTWSGGVLFEVTPTEPTATTLSFSPNPSAYGQAVTLTAVVASNIGPPADGETVTFMKGTVSLGTGTLSGGSATLTTSALVVGTSSITAVYGGDSKLSSSTSAAEKEVVSKATTSTTLVSSQNPSSAGQSVTLTASVTPQFSGKITGTVSFYDGTTLLKTAGSSGGVAKYTTKTLTSGAHTITATFNGSASFSGSSTALTQTVN